MIPLLPSILASFLASSSFSVTAVNVDPHNHVRTFTDTIVGAYSKPFTTTAHYYLESKLDTTFAGPYFDKFPELPWVIYPDPLERHQSLLFGRLSGPNAASASTWDASSRPTDAGLKSKLFNVMKKNQEYLQNLGDNERFFAEFDAPLSEPFTHPTLQYLHRLKLERDRAERNESMANRSPTLWRANNNENARSSSLDLPRGSVDNVVTADAFYSSLRPLGTGQCGYVYTGKLRHPRRTPYGVIANGTSVAIKVQPVRVEINSRALCDVSTITEMQTMGLTSWLARYNISNFFIKPYGIYTSAKRDIMSLKTIGSTYFMRGFWYLEMEQVGLSLKDKFLEKNVPIPDAIALEWFYGEWTSIRHLGFSASDNHAENYAFKQVDYHRVYHIGGKTYFVHKDVPMIKRIDLGRVRKAYSTSFWGRIRDMIPNPFTACPMCDVAAMVTVNDNNATPPKSNTTRIPDAINKDHILHEHMDMNRYRERLTAFNVFNQLKIKYLSNFETSNAQAALEELAKSAGSGADKTFAKHFSNLIIKDHQSTDDGPVREFWSHPRK